MSDLSHAAPTVRAAVESIQNALFEGMSASAQADASAFCRAFFARMPEEELTARDPHRWAAMLAAFIGFAKQPKPGVQSVKVFNPALSEDGFESAHTVVQIVSDDMPFLVDSVTMALAGLDIQIHTLIHPVMRLQRDPSGHLLGVGERGKDESLMQTSNWIARPRSATCAASRMPSSMR